MKQLITALLFFAFSSPIMANEAMRQELDLAWKNEKYADQLIAKLEKNTNEKNQGYLAVAYMMKSNHASMPWTKLKYFFKGKKTLEKAITNEPDRVELRFFRYEIQVKIPKGLKYNNLEEDKKMMIIYLENEQNKNKDESLYSKIQLLNLKKL
ncbi:MAG: hypothetical protein ACK567_07015 [Chitinophagales bacterium]|jgi:hypothetical protein|nr:hypothetical protein [Sphingobacteriales bacterium]